MDKSSDKKPFSFGFTKKVEKQQIEQTAISGKNTDKEEETDFVLELAGKEVKSVKPKEAPQELVIPLIQKNVWQRGERSFGKEQSKGTNGDKKTEAKHAGNKSSGAVDNEAVEELLKEAALHKDEWEDRDVTDLNMAIPLLMRNKVPEGYEEDEKLDVSLRPTETSGEDYDNVPIEQFGMAMLRGMGFKEEEGIGDKMKKTVKPIEVTVRPKGQGLGADKRPVMPKKNTKRKPGDKKVEEEPIGIAKGVGVLVTSGPHKNLYGKIEGVDDDNARVVIKLAISNQSVTLSQYGVQIVDKEDYRKHARDLGKFSRGHDEIKRRKEKIEEDDRKRDRKKNGHDSPSDQSRRKRDRDDERRHKKKHSDYDSDDRSDYERTDCRKHKDDGERTSKHKHKRDDQSDRYREREKRKREDDGNDDYDRKRDRRKDEDRDRKDKDRQRSRDKYNQEDEDNRTKDDRYDKKEKTRKEDSEHSASKPSNCWLRPDLRVRFVDKNFKKGRYYNSKVAIIDVVTMETCTCKTEDGRLLEEIHQDMIETLIPKTDPGYIMVVTGKLKGQLGTVLKRDKVNCQAAVQLLQDRDQIVKLDYNDICEYVGDIQANEDY